MKWKVALQLTLAAYAATACHPKMRDSKPPTDQANIPLTLDLVPTTLPSAGDAARIESAKIVLLSLGEIQGIDEHVLSRDTPSPKWLELPQEHKNVATQLQAQCQIIKKQTRPDLTTLSPTAQFHYGSDLHTEGTTCPAMMSRITESHGQVITLDKATKGASYRTATSLKSVTEFNDPAHQQILGMTKSEFTMQFKLDVVRERGEKTRSYSKVTGMGFVVLTNHLRRVDFELRGKELFRSGTTKSVILLNVVSNGETFHYAFRTEGAGPERKLKSAYVGNLELNEEDIAKFKVDKLVARLSLSIN